MKQYGILIAIIVLVALFIMPKYLAQKSQMLKVNQDSWNKSSLTINGVNVDVRLAQTPQQHKQGLSGTESLKDNEGMLFEFDKNSKSPPIFWMKGMLIPLDMIWIKHNKVVHLHENVPAPSPDTPDEQLKLYAPNDPVDYVLEVNAGFSKANNIKIGDSVDLSSLQK